LSPATETPATETPAAETPVETPAEETPVIETPAEETPVIETPVEETPVVVDVEPIVDTEPVVETEPTPLVRDSVQAKPGQLGLTKASQAGADLSKSVRGEISKVASKIDEAVKKAFGKPAKKAAAESDAGSSNTGADSDSGSNE
jgi:ribonuclease E